MTLQQQVTAIHTNDNSKDAALAVALNDVSCLRSGTEVLRGINLQIPHGEWVSIAGANGSGKSTLVRLLIGLGYASEGTVTVGETEVAPDTADKVRAQVGMVFANPDNQFVGLTVADDIVFGLENRQVARDEMKKRLQQYAARLEITSLLDRHPATLSGGQKQRVALAAVLAAQPTVLILDEALSMLDAVARRDCMQLLHELKQSGEYTIITVTHDAEEMLAADRLLLLEDGKVIADGLPQLLLAQQNLTARCRIKQPYLLELCHCLREQGIDVADHATEKELLEKLWAYNSNKSPTITPPTI